MAAGWTSAALLEPKVPTTTKYAQSSIRNATVKANSTELWFFNKVFRQEDGWKSAIDHELAKHPRPARSRPVDRLELLALVGWIIGKNLMAGDKSDSLPSGVGSAVASLKSFFVSKDRRATLHGAFNFSRDNLTRLSRAMSIRFVKLIIPGCVLVIDESILETASLKAALEGMLRYIKSKPRPKGLFFNGALQRFLYSGSVYILDLEIKWDFNSLSMADALLEIVRRLEEACARTFVVLADSGFPASKLLLRPTTTIKSKFICSVSASHVSGSLHTLAVAASSTLAFGQETTLYNPHLQLMAYAHKTKKYTICLVTNWDVRFHSRRTEARITYTQAAALAKHFTVAEMVNALRFPRPDPGSREETNAWLYIRKVFGVNLAYPTDDEGYVTEATLSDLKKLDLQRIARIIGVKQHDSTKKAELVSKILKHHPGTKPQERPPAHPTKKRKATWPVSDEEFRKVKRNFQDMKKLLMKESARPEFAQLYSQSYGWQDRFNALLYSTFKPADATRPEAKLTWMLLYTCVINSCSLWQEHQASLLPTPKARAAFRHRLPPLSTFASNLVIQLASYIEGELERTTESSLPKKD